MHLPVTLLIFGIAIIILFIVAKIVIFSTKAQTNPTGDFRYEIKPFLSPAERSFFGVLQTAIASDYQIFAKVRLADIVNPIQNSSRSGWQSAFNRISGKHVDFVLCNSASLTVEAVIELDDSTHKRLERGIRDSFVDEILVNATIPVLRISAQQSYSPAQIREQIQNILRDVNRKL
jgi:hypothetical protein